MDHKHSRKLLIQHRLKYTDYESGQSAIFRVTSNKFDVDRLQWHRSHNVINYFPNNNSNSTYRIFNRKQGTLTEEEFDPMTMYT
jgi:hypothetical protein